MTVITKVISAAGSGTFTVPSGVTKLDTVLLIGSGGAGEQVSLGGGRVSPHLLLHRRPARFERHCIRPGQTSRRLWLGLHCLKIFFHEFGPPVRKNILDGKGRNERPITPEAVQFVAFCCRIERVKHFFIGPVCSDDPDQAAFYTWPQDLASNSEFETLARRPALLDENCGLMTTPFLRPGYD